MSEQSDALNNFAREKMGAKADAAAGAAPHLHVLKNDDDGGEKKPEIAWVRLPTDGYQLSEFARECGRILRENGVFRRDRVPVTVERDGRQRGSIIDMTPERFRSYVEAHMVTYKVKRVGDGELKLRATMPKETATGTLHADTFILPQRQLDRVNLVRLPAWRSDGRIELLPEGYDPETRTLTLPGTVQIDEQMTLERGRKIIDDLLSEFPFGDWLDGRSRSKAVAISAMFGMFGVGLQPLDARRMNFVYTSNSQGSGKTLLAEIAVVPVCGPARVQSRPDNHEEMRKVLDTIAMNGAPYLFLDDLEGNLKDNTLNAFMTSTVWSGRVLGSQREFAVPKMAVVFLTGNNLTLSTDIARRTLLCELYVEESDPQARVVRRIIDSQWLNRPEARRDILSALWAIVRAWDEAGRPGCSRTLRGYEEWSRIFGGIVEWAGWGNPLAAPHSEHAGDTEWADMQEMVSSIVRFMDEQEVRAAEYTFNELLQCCRDLECFAWMIDGKEDKEGKFEPSAKCRSALGKLWSGKYGGRLFVVAEKRVRFGYRGRNRSRKYRVEIVS